MALHHLGTHFERGSLVVGSYDLRVHGGAVIERARRRAGLARDELARRLGTTAATISRWETGAVDPAFQTVERAVAACGLDLACVLREPDPDPHDLALLETTLALTVDQRAQRLIDYVRAVRSGRQTPGARRA